MKFVFSLLILFLINGCGTKQLLSCLVSPCNEIYIHTPEESKISKQGYENCRHVGESHKYCTNKWHR